MLSLATDPTIDAVAEVIALEAQIAAATAAGLTVTTAVLKAELAARVANAYASAPKGRRGSWVNVLDFGATGLGVADDTVAIQNAISQMAAAGGGEVYFPKGTYKITATLTLSASNVRLVGDGGDTNHNVAFTASGSILTWAGSVGGTMLSVFTPNGATIPAVNNVTVRGLKFSCNGTAATAVEGISLSHCAFEDLNVYNPTAQAFNLYCQTQTEVTSFRRCTFKRISVRAIDAGATSAHGFVLNGNALGNVSFNTFEDCQVIHKDGDGYRLLDADNNLFLCTYAFRAVGGTGFGLTLHGGANANVAARGNHFIHFSANAGVKAYGTTTYVAPSNSNNIWFYDRQNGCPDPVLETGALLYLHNDKGAFESFVAKVAALGDNQTNADAARAALGTESLRIVNGSDDHIRLADVAVANVWRVLVQAASGDLMLTRAVGTGALNLGGGSDVKMRGLRFTSATAAPSAGTWAVGDRCWNSTPVVGQPKGWMCTVAGTPGTWVSEGNL